MVAEQNTNIYLQRDKDREISIPGERNVFKEEHKQA
jgi:hypothetical protein